MNSNSAGVETYGNDFVSISDGVVRPKRKWLESLFGFFRLPRVAGIENTSGMSPEGHAVLVRTYEPELKTRNIELPEFVKERMEMTDQRALVIAVGGEAWRKERRPRAKPGDKVLVTRYAGFVVSGKDSLDGHTYRLVNDRDIFCRITEERQESWTI